MTGVQTCALPIWPGHRQRGAADRTIRRPVAGRCRHWQPAFPENLARLIPPVYVAASDGVGQSGSGPRMDHALSDGSGLRCRILA